MVPHFFEKGFSFPENSFQDQSNENVQNFQWLSHKNMQISQTEGYFENPLYHFLEEPILLLLVLKSNLSEKVFSSVKTKTNLNFAMKHAERNNHSFSVYLMNHLFQISKLFIMWLYNV